mgnify:CR=1 FL=1
MTIKEAQQQVDQWIHTIGVRYFSELTNMACLTEEVGELAPENTVTSLSKKEKNVILKKKWQMYFGFLSA